MVARGQSAALPPPDMQSDRQRQGFVFTHRDEFTETTKSFDFSAFPVSRTLRLEFADAFEAASGPLGSLHARASMSSAFDELRYFATMLSHLPDPPQRSASFRPSHLTQMRILRSSSGFSTLKSVLRQNFDLYGVEVQTILSQARTPPKAGSPNPTTSYSVDEFRRILAAARAQVRIVRRRIRSNLDLLKNWREEGAGLSETDQHRGKLLDHLARTGNLPRESWNEPLPALKGVTEAGFENAAQAYSSLFLTADDVYAFAILLLGLTGINSGTLARATIAHHRADDQTVDDTGVAIVDLLKPRRGKWLGRMTLPFSDAPTWPMEVDSEPSRSLDTPFSVYELLVELGEPARKLRETEALFVRRVQMSSVSYGGGTHFRPGLPRESPKAWGQARGIKGDDGLPLEVLFKRLRLTYVQVRNEPVAHTKSTMRSDYQRTDRRDLLRYQKVVAEVLQSQVVSARNTNMLAFLNLDDARLAEADVEVAAKKYGVAIRTMERVLAGLLDTVLAACADNDNGPYTPGRACEASFLLCTGCPCAISLPSHWPVQVVAYDEILALKSETTPLRWAEQYGPAWARLSDLISKMPEGAEAIARRSATEADRDLIRRMLARELDS
jgi:hypothetical protein